MKTFQTKLIVLRGNSGSGKSTVAKKLREASNRKIAIVEQDYLRRFVLKEKETESENNIGLIQQTVTYALSKNYDVVLDGILYFPRYGKMLRELTELCPDNYFYYFDIPFEETLRRHTTKPNAHEFGEKEMREWWHEHDVSGFPDEKIIPASSSLDAIVKNIIEDCGL